MKSTLSLVDTGQSEAELSVATEQRELTVRQLLEQPGVLNAVLAAIPDDFRYPEIGDNPVATKRNLALAFLLEWEPS